MKIYVLITDDGQSSVVSGVYSSKEKVLNAISTVFRGENLNRVEEWDLDNGFVSYLNVSKKTVITIED
jgi:hypothetical protein